MLVRDLMENKQLNLNQPLLSVRRLSSTIASESENKSKTTDNSLARLPFQSYKSGPVRNAGAIPFQWEKTPGKPKDESKISTHVVEEPFISPKLKQQDYDIIFASLDKKVTKFESYQDAVETHSRTESFFMSCGMSVYDDQEVHIKPNGNFSSDEKACEFMIDCFLPTAKAMVSETPQCTKKSCLGQRQQKRLSPLNRHRPKSLRHKEVGVFESGETSYETPNVEKTLYIDSIHKAKFQTNHKGDDFETLERDSDTNKNLSVDASLDNSHRLDDSPFLVCSENPSSGMQMEITNYDSNKMDSEKLGTQGSDLDKDSISISSSKMVEHKIIDDDNLIKSRSINKLIDREYTMEDDGKIDLESQCGVKLGHHELSDTTDFFEIPLVLPSLKAPSESWLKRTLPEISKSNTSSKCKPCCKYLFMTASLCHKRETIVKSSNVQHGRVHKEVLKPIQIPED